MKLNRKLLVIAKGISVWWGIYLILGCCAGFAVKTIQGLFMEKSTFEIMMYTPLMCAGALVLAILTYFLNMLAKRAPAKRLRKKLFAVMKTEGFSSSYINMLFDNARGDMRNIMLIEAACAYCLKGEAENAQKTLEVVDLVSVLDVAQSTGDFRTAAYYYCVKMGLCIILKDNNGAARAYDDGIYYIDAFSDNDIVMAILSLYQTEAGMYNSAIDTIDRIKWRILPASMKKYGKSFSAYIKACNYLKMGKNDDSIVYARMSLEAPCSEYIASEAEEIIRKAKAAKHSSPSNEKILAE